MLPLYFQRCHLRRSAGLTLLAWVLALLTGMVNACQVQPHGAGTQVSVVSTQGEPAGAGGPDGQANTDKPACLKFCDDESSTVVKGETAKTDLPGIVKGASIDWPPAMPTATVATWRSVVQQAAQGPPLFIRFLHLTI